MGSEIIIGRKKELKILKELVASSRAEFVAVYGRRRIGKTFLIRNFSCTKGDLFFHVTGMQKGTLKEQLEEFANQIERTFQTGVKIAVESTWMKMFAQLHALLEKVGQKKKIILFFDEFPWMATPKSRLLNALELYWNRYWSFDPRVKLIVCGSATSWIIEKIVNNKGGLHNRVTRTMEIRPFSLSEVKELLSYKKIRLNHRQILDIYLVIGGVPLYWNYIKKGMSASQAIDEICFQQNSPLLKEFDRLFDSLFDDAESYKSIIKSIAKSRNGIKQADLMKSSGLSRGGYTAKKMQHLEEAGFISSFLPYGNKDKGIYFKVDDEYCLFYLHWIAPHRKSIERGGGDSDFWAAQALQPRWRTWAALSFEATCFKHLTQIRQALNIPKGSIAASWRYSPRKKEPEEGAQIDLLFDRPDNAITICEIKYSEDQFAIDKAYAKNLMRKLDVFSKKTKTKKQLFINMITTLGVKPTMYSEELVTGEVTLENLF